MLSDDLLGDDELNKLPKNGSEYWCCPITPLQHYVPGCLKRNRWVRNYDYQRTKRERRAHTNIQYDLTKKAVFDLTRSFHALVAMRTGMEYRPILGLEYIEARKSGGGVE